MSSLRNLMPALLIMASMGASDRLEGIEADPDPRKPEPPEPGDRPDRREFQAPRPLSPEHQRIVDEARARRTANKLTSHKPKV